jgi:hypothetical protein
MSYLLADLVGDLLADPGLPTGEALGKNNIRYVAAWVYMYI